MQCVEIVEVHAQRLALHPSGARATGCTEGEAEGEAEAEAEGEAEAEAAYPRGGQSHGDGHDQTGTRGSHASVLDQYAPGASTWYTIMADVQGAMGAPPAAAGGLWPIAESQVESALPPHIAGTLRTTQHEAMYEAAHKATMHEAEQEQEQGSMCWGAPPASC